MNEEQNVNTNPKPKKKRSFWWLKLLLIIILVAAGVIGGIMLASQEITQQLLGEFFPQYAVSSVENTVPVETLAPNTIEKPIEFATPTPAPKPSKAPVEIISPEAAEKAEATEAPEIKNEPEETVEPSITPAPEESPEPSVLPAFAPVIETPAPEVDEPATAAAEELIGIDAALEAALKHAKLEEDEVVVYGVSREKDDGAYYYEVEFLYRNQEYEYEINAFNGAVEGWKILRERQGSGYGYGYGNAFGSGYGPAYGSSQASADENVGGTLYISQEEAKEAALSHAGYREHETTDMNVELNIDNNRVVYEVEFWAEGYDYDYKVCAITGLILTVEKDRG